MGQLRDCFVDGWVGQWIGVSADTEAWLTGCKKKKKGYLSANIKCVMTSESSFDLWFEQLCFAKTALHG